MKPLPLAFAAAFGAALISPVSRAQAPASAEPGLLFYLSGDHSTTADVAFPGTAKPNWDNEVTSVADGAKGAGLSAGDHDRLAYWAPGNAYAQRGTLSLFWRSRTPVGPTPFVLFRIGQADSSTWDMSWLRIDYNGHGFDAFVTDASLSRIRVSVPVASFPGPKEWTHLAVAWDETQGIRFYVNGKLAARQDQKAILDFGLDQLGATWRIIGPTNVQSDYNFDRGSDVDEVRIYDRALDAKQIAQLAKLEPLTGLAPLAPRSLRDRRTREEWWFNHGWNRPDDPPPVLPAAATTVGKVEITDAYDHGRWWWKATDGIRETTWPGMYNRSRLPGRDDYFELPDWDCYVESGQAITFYLPDEPWNHLEFSGAAWGAMSLLNGSDANDAPARALLFQRPKGQERTVHAFAQPIVGHKIRFTNVEQEQPIGELGAYNVVPGHEPAGSAKLSYRLASVRPEAASLAPVVAFIAGRHPADERAMLVAEPENAPADAPGAQVAPAPDLPLVHILIPNEATVPGYQLDQVDGGLDGIAIDLPALNLKPTHGGLIPLNIQVKDPLWSYRDMLDFSFSVKPGEAKTLWLDLRDRILPQGKALYLSIACASGEFGPASLAQARIRLVFKPRADALAEHELDRFTQARDSYAWLTEEHPHSPYLNTWVRFKAEIDDLMKVAPNHWPGRDYYAVGVTGAAPKIDLPAAPPGVPLWAFRQVDLLGRVQSFVEWYIDHRQVPYGDFGGGISDDDDFTNMWPGVAFMGANPPKFTASLRQLIDACYKNHMFTNGLSTIQADELHGYEEGIEALGEGLILQYGDPTLIERGMETQRGVEGITGINAAGHRHIMTSFYNGKKMSTDGVWGWSKPSSYLVLQPGELIVNYNGNPRAKQILLELADGLLAHRKADEDGHYSLPSAIEFATDKEGVNLRASTTWPLFWVSWSWTHQDKYLGPILDNGVEGVTAVNANALDILNLRQKLGPSIVGAAGGGRRGGRRRPDAAEAVAQAQATGAKGSAFEGRGGPTPPGNMRFTALNHFKWQLTGDKKQLENLYGSQIATCEQLKFIDTEGSLWIDRIGMPYTDLQRARLGGIALVRGGTISGQVASWVFHAPATDQSVGLLIPDATATGFKVIAYNLEAMPVRATMTGWNIDPGVWEITQGTSSANADDPDSPLSAREQDFGSSRSVELTFAPRTTTIVTFKLKTPGVPYWQRPDLGISREDVQAAGGALTVKVHNLGSVPSPATNL
ncbi:MAG TPA: LamG domain-containing protein, partial [Opitutaceae bacterium]|nr:LamG domain-containing protein [Opitutaceae bacterium]